MIHASKDDAFRDGLDNIEARKELARLGSTYVLVAEIRPAGGPRGPGFELVDVCCVPHHGFESSPTRRIIKYFDSHTCPVCDRVGEIRRSTPTNSVLSDLRYLAGLDPEHCVGCWDICASVMVTPGVPTPDGSFVAVPRPE